MLDLVRADCDLDTRCATARLPEHMVVECLRTISRSVERGRVDRCTAQYDDNRLFGLVEQIRRGIGVCARDRYRNGVVVDRSAAISMGGNSDAKKNRSQSTLQRFHRILLALPEVTNQTEFAEKTDQERCASLGASRSRCANPSPPYPRDPPAAPPAHLQRICRRGRAPRTDHPERPARRICPARRAGHP